MCWRWSMRFYLMRGGLKPKLKTWISTFAKRFVVLVICSPSQYLLSSRHPVEDQLHMCVRVGYICAVQLEGASEEAIAELETVVDHFLTVAITSLPRVLY